MRKRAAAFQLAFQCSNCVSAVKTIMSYLNAARLRKLILLETKRQKYLNSKRFEVHIVAEVADTSAGSQQGFGRHATPVHTCAAYIMPLDNSDLHALLYCMQSCSMPTNTTPNDNQVIVV